MYRITVEEFSSDTSNESIGIERYRQCVDQIDLVALIKAINQQKRTRSDKGKSRVSIGNKLLA